MEGQIQNVVPQEGTRSVGESLPGTSVPGCSTDSGGSEICISQSGSGAVGNQAAPSGNATGRPKRQEEASAAAGRPQDQRRRSSLPDYAEYPANKRKRRATADDQSGASMDMSQLDYDWRRLNEVTKELERLIAVNVTTKLEIKRAVGDLSKVVGSLAGGVSFLRTRQPMEEAVVREVADAATQSAGPLMNHATKATQCSGIPLKVTKKTVRPDAQRKKREAPLVEGPRQSEPVPGPAGGEPASEGADAEGFTTVSRYQRGRKAKFKEPHGGSRGTGQMTAAKAKAQTMRKPLRNEQVVIVKSSRQTYAELLKTVKKEVDVAPVGAQITSMRRAADNSLVIRLKRTAGKAEALQEAITSRGLDGVTAVVPKRMAVVHVKDLDGEATKEEITEGVMRVAASSGAGVGVRVTSLRPAFGGTQNATVVLPVQAANALVKTGRIKIGWVSCRVRLREDSKKCFRCWAEGHLARDCKGPDRSSSCFRCGKEGHKKSACPGS